jgi:hypothetical protein
VLLFVPLIEVLLYSFLSTVLYSYFRYSTRYLGIVLHCKLETCIISDTKSKTQSEDENIRTVLRHGLL